jgi:hypothetical protein
MKIRTLTYDHAIFIIQIVIFDKHMLINKYKKYIENFDEKHHKRLHIHTMDP